MGLAGAPKIKIKEKSIPSAQKEKNVPFALRDMAGKKV